MITLEKPHVLIIGAGICGLSLAIGLRKRGFKVSIYEKAKELRELGTGVVMAPNGTKAAYHIDESLGKSLTSFFGQAGHPEDPFRVVNKQELLITSIPNEFSTQKNHFHHKFCLLRSTIQKVLLDALPKDCIHQRKKAVRFEESKDKVTVFFEDQTQATGDLLIGCDGWHSVVRTSFHSNTKKLYLGVTSVRSVAKLKDFRHKNGCIVSDRINDYMLFCVPLHDKPDHYYVSSVFKAPEGLWPSKPKESVKEELLKKIGGKDHFAREIVELSADDNQYVADLACMEPMKEWSTARVTIAGDAAHPVSPVIGQGINTAFEDAALLSKLLDHHHKSPEVAFQLYQKNRIPRMAKVMKLGYKFTDLMVTSVPMERWEKPVLRNIAKARRIFRFTTGMITGARLGKILNDYEL